MNGGSPFPRTHILPPTLSPSPSQSLPFSSTFTTALIIPHLPPHRRLSHPSCLPSHSLHHITFFIPSPRTSFPPLSLSLSPPSIPSLRPLYLTPTQLIIIFLTVSRKLLSLKVKTPVPLYPSSPDTCSSPVVPLSLLPKTLKCLLLRVSDSNLHGAAVCPHTYRRGWWGNSLCPPRLRTNPSPATSLCARRSFSHRVFIVPPLSTLGF